MKELGKILILQDEDRIRLKVEMLDSCQVSVYEGLEAEGEKLKEALEDFNI